MSRSVTYGANEGRNTSSVERDRTTTPEAIDILDILHVASLGAHMLCLRLHFRFQGVKWMADNCICSAIQASTDRRIDKLFLPGASFLSVCHVIQLELTFIILVTSSNYSNN